jgi:hypothetical protein
VRDEIQREVERCDRKNRAERKSADDSGAVGSRRLPIEGQPFSADTRSFFGGDGEGENSAVDFSARGLDRLPCFFRDQRRKFFAPSADGVGDRTEDALLFVARKLAGDLETANGGCDGCIGVGLRAAPGVSDDGPIKWREDVESLALGHPFAIDEIRPVFY